MTRTIALLSLPVVTVLAIAACSSDDAATPAQTATDAGATADTGSATTIDSGADDVDAGTDAATEPAGPCAPGLACTAVDTSCIGVFDNAAVAKPGLRMNQVTLKTPAAFATGLLATTFASAARSNNAGCNLNGTGTWSWLLQADPTAGTLKIGGAKPVADPTAGYSFDDETLQGFHVQPTTLTTTIARGAAFSVATGGNLVMPVFLNTDGTSAAVLPLHQVRLTGTLSANGDCIGTYNAAGLDPTNNCQPDSTHASFLSGGSGTAFILLEEADTSIVAPLNESLCVVLSGNAATYGDNASPAKCKRTIGQINFAGDWCSTTNAAATATCHDAVSVTFDYAASSVKIDN